MTDEEILNFVSNPVAEDNHEVDDTTDKPIIPSHSEAFECFSKCILWLEAQPDSDPVSVQLLRHLQQNTVNKRETATNSTTTCFPYYVITNINLCFPFVSLLPFRILLCTSTKRSMIN